MMEEDKGLKDGLKKTTKGFWSPISSLFNKPDTSIHWLETLEEALISSDVGVDPTFKILESLKQNKLFKKIKTLEDLKQLLKEELIKLFNEHKPQLKDQSSKPYVIMMVGVNGSGKTTTAGKLTNLFKTHGKEVVLGAADTYRAAAVEQLQVWGDRLQVPVVKNKQGNSPAAVVYDTLDLAKQYDKDIVIIDTSGRLHNNTNLMNELTKVKGVVNKALNKEPDEVLLVLDASIGQNAIEQVKHFSKATDVTGLVLTKLDGTAKGGVVIGIVSEFNIPVRYIGVGENKEDLTAFDPEMFLSAWFD